MDFNKNINTAVDALEDILNNTEETPENKEFLDKIEDAYIILVDFKLKEE